jgi:hypothetical protein
MGNAGNIKDFDVSGRPVGRLSQPIHAQDGFDGRDAGHKRSAAGHAG